MHPNRRRAHYYHHYQHYRTTETTTTAMITKIFTRKPGVTDPEWTQGQSIISAQAPISEAARSLARSRPPTRGERYHPANQPALHRLWLVIHRNAALFAAAAAAGEECTAVSAAASIKSSSSSTSSSVPCHFCSLRRSANRSSSSSCRRPRHRRGADLHPRSGPRRDKSPFSFCFYVSPSHPPAARVPSDDGIPKFRSQST